LTFISPFGLTKTSPISSAGLCFLTVSLIFLSREPCAFISSFANFDGAQYLTLVREGYNTYTQAYFPLYFLLVRAVALLFPTPNAIRSHNDMLSAVLVSNVSFVLGLILFKKYLKTMIPVETHRNASLLFLLLFPTSFFFGAVYTEGLFFFLCIGSLYFLKKKNYWLAECFYLFPFCFLSSTENISCLNASRYTLHVTHLLFFPLLLVLEYTVYTFGKRSAILSFSFTSNQCLEQTDQLI